MGPRLFKVESIGSGLLAVMAKPLSGEWIDDEFAGIAASGINHIVSLLESGEAYEVGLDEEETVCGRHGMSFESYPIPDRGLPPSLHSFARFARDTWTRIDDGVCAVVHCRAGIGRTGVVAAGILLHAGYGPEDAFSRISEARGVSVPDTEEQYRWIVEHHRDIVAVT